jgi:hypothetical protein
MHFPILALASDRELAKSIFAYTNTWIELLQAIYRNAEYADKIDISKTQQLVSSLLRLDKVYIKTPHEWKCVLTPLNPLCIEKIRSIAESLEYTKSMFAGEGLITESENSIEVTNCVHIDKMITNSECDSVLLYAGDVDGLCVYESDNRQAYGEDGVDSIKEILQSFIAFAPYARRQLRIRVVNAPSPITILRLLKDHLQKYPDSKLACTFLYTYPQNAFSETFKLEYDMADYEICEAIKQERLTINMGGEVKSIHQISRECNEPSHIALYFDIAQIPSDFYANRSSGTVDNIASLHSNCFGRASAKENKVADIYNKVAEMYAIKNDDLKTDTSTINCDTLSSIATMESRNAIWIATIDRFEQEWTRDDLKVIGKKRFGRRVTTLLTSIDSRIFDRYLSYLRGYLIYPNRNMFTASLGRIISIFPDNILCIPGLDGERGNLTKRVAGATIKALATETYLSLVSDHFLCGIKLQVKKDSFEKVITGIHYNSLENVFTVDVLEFQHSDDNSADVKLLSGEDSASDAEEIIETNDNNVHGNIADYDTLIDTILNIQNLLNGEIDANKGKTAGNIKAQIIDQYLKNLLNSNDNINSKIADVEKIAFNVRGSVIVVNLNSNINSKSINNFTYRGTNMRTITITAGYLKILYSSEKC